MAIKNDWKIAIIGGGGKFAATVMLEILYDENLGGGKIYLYSRTPEKVINNINLAGKVCPPQQQKFKLISSNDLDTTLEGADIVFYTATAQLQPFGEYKAMGIHQGAHILYIADKVKILCPDAWFLISTNPPDVPIVAAYDRFNPDKVIGLCDAPVLTKKVLSAFLSCKEDDLNLNGIGVNHEIWFYNITYKGKSVYDELRERLPSEYDPSRVRSDYLDIFPEWKSRFINNIELLNSTGYLFTPIGGCQRFSGLTQPLPLKLSNLVFDKDFSSCLQKDVTVEDIFSITRRTAAGTAFHVADVIKSILKDDRREHAVQVINKGMLPAYPYNAVFQVSCKISNKGVERPVISQLPDFINNTLASRILQEHMKGMALAKQDEEMMRQAILVVPEGVDISNYQGAVKV